MIDLFQLKRQIQIPRIESICWLKGITIEMYSLNLSKTLIDEQRQSVFVINIIMVLTGDMKIKIFF